MKHCGRKERSYAPKWRRRVGQGVVGKVRRRWKAVRADKWPPADCDVSI